MVFLNSLSICSWIIWIQLLRIKLTLIYKIWTFVPRYKRLNALSFCWLQKLIKLFLFIILMNYMKNIKEEKVYSTLIKIILIKDLIKLCKKSSKQWTATFYVKLMVEKSIRKRWVFVNHHNLLQLGRKFQLLHLKIKV